RVSGTDREDLIGGIEARQCRRVASRGEEVARDFLVVFETEAGVDDDVVGPFPAGIEGAPNPLDTELRPAIGPGNAGEDREPTTAHRVGLADPVQFRTAQAVLAGEPAGGGEAR